MYFPMERPPFSRDNDLNRHESTLPKNSFIEVSYDLNKFDLHYLKMLHYKYQLLQPNCFWEDSFKRVFVWFFSMYKFNTHYGPTLFLGNLIETNLNLHYMKKLLKKFYFLQPNCFEKNIVKVFWSILFFQCNNSNPIMAPSYPWGS